MDIITPAQNTDKLKTDLDDFLNLYYGAELRNMDGLLDDLLNVMVENNIALPREFVMIGRGIALIEDTGKKLDPTFNAAEELKKLSRKIVINKYKPERIAKSSINYLLQLEHLAKDLPDTINNTISKIENGKLEVNLKHLEVSELINQLSVSLILSALIIGSSLAMFIEKGYHIFGYPILGLIGFVVSGILGIYLIIQYMIERE